MQAQYLYDAWGTCATFASKPVGQLNPLRYRGYVYDQETGLYYLQSRYYDPTVGRFINADNVISGADGSVQGKNAFAYCFNNPTNLDDSSGNWPEWTKKVVSAVTKAAKKVVSTVAKATKKVVSTVTNAANLIKSAVILANHVQKIHYTTPKVTLDYGSLIGRVQYSVTSTKKNKEPGLIHSTTDVGNDATTDSAGINIAGWLGADIGVSTETNAFVSVQVTPWIHGGVSIGLEGIGVVLGLDDGDISHNIEIYGGWGLIALFAVPEFLVLGALA